jgi:hypothetical protein
LPRDGGEDLILNKFHHAKSFRFNQSASEAGSAGFNFLEMLDDGRHGGQIMA